uniref:Uncharacterized protein n=1 Tax=Glossina palpalis gambiensis TaxID=67801 RepID=A0A1B0AQ19_9MUSC
MVDPLKIFWVLTNSTYLVFMQSSLTRITIIGFALIYDILDFGKQFEPKYRLARMKKVRGTAKAKIAQSTRK